MAAAERSSSSIATSFDVMWMNGLPASRTRLSADGAYVCRVHASGSATAGAPSRGGVNVQA